MKQSVIIGLILIGVVVQSGMADPPAKPNIILFIVDDMGWQDTSVEFHSQRTVWNDLYKTPNMQRLADRGMKFTNAYSAHPVCSPTRSSIMTGKNPARTGVDDWVGHGQSANRYLKSPQWASKGLQPNDGNTTLPTILKTNGYRTIHIGKAHFGGSGTAGADPSNLGFDINIAGSHGGGPWGGWYSPWLGNYKAMYPNMEDQPQGEYLTDAITVKANELIADAAKDNVPFFMNMAQFAVHTAIAAAPNKYMPPNDGRPTVERNYASMLHAMDASLGLMMDTLDDPNGDGDTADSIADNTIILFMSDNGGLSNHTRSRVGEVTLEDGTKVTFKRDYHNGPIKSGKGSGYEGGVRVPMIVGWAGQNPQGQPINSQLKITPGSSSNEPVHSDDFFPTILSMAGVTNPVPAEQLDGKDLTPLLQGQAFERDGGLYWHYPHQWYQDVGVGLGIEPFSAVRKGDWKLIYFYGDGVADGQGYDPRLELYNLTNDIGEEHNLLLTNKEKAVEMRDMLMQWLKDVDAGLPIIKATGKAVVLPAIGSPISAVTPGDLNADSSVDDADWQIFKDGFGTDVSHLDQFEAYAMGDLIADGFVDQLDFREFKRVYDLANGDGSFAVMLSTIPETHNDDPSGNQ